MFKPNRVFYKLRGVLLLPVYVLAVFCTYGETENWFDIAFGGFLFSSGLFLRIWAQMHLHYRLKEHKKLTITGPYTLVRNPIYIGNTLIMCGVTFICELVWLAPFMLAACAVVYTHVVRYEENYLAQKYGAPYEDYLSQVPRWLPAALTLPAIPRHAVRRFFISSLIAEAHILLLLILPIGKEMMHPW